MSDEEVEHGSSENDSQDGDRDQEGLVPPMGGNSGGIPDSKKSLIAAALLIPLCLAVGIWQMVKSPESDTQTQGEQEKKQDEEETPPVLATPPASPQQSADVAALTSQVLILQESITEQSREIESLRTSLTGHSAAELAAREALLAQVDQKIDNLRSSLAVHSADEVKAHEALLAKLDRKIESLRRSLRDHVAAELAARQDLEARVAELERQLAAGTGPRPTSRPVTPPASRPASPPTPTPADQVALTAAQQSVVDLLWGFPRCGSVCQRFADLRTAMAEVFRLEDLVSGTPPSAEVSAQRACQLEQLQLLSGHPINPRACRDLRLSAKAMADLEESREAQWKAVGGAWANVSYRGPQQATMRNLARQYAALYRVSR